MDARRFTKILGVYRLYLSGRTKNSIAKQYETDWNTCNKWIKEAEMILAKVEEFKNGGRV